MRPRLVIMVKEPVAGRVKTRLGRDIGMVPAAWWMRHQLASLVRRLRDPRWDLVLAVAPDRAVGSRMLPEMTIQVPQGSGTLGDRMALILKGKPKRLNRKHRAATDPRVAQSRRPGGRAPLGVCLQTPAGQCGAARRCRRAGHTSWDSSPTLITGADIPGITPAHIARAFHALGAHDAVIGPAPDGGFWLIGMGTRTPPATLFQNVRWSTEHALADTLSTLPGWKIAQIDTLRDVDTAADLPSNRFANDAPARA
ncbi:DUF2064 domain-containing protein [Pseudooceanicola sp. MF1-13]|uniref:TIGR04282 family arsenosugar biosynthesis glycosyltransferase n=1 Tax=Pseudooceanicola sp. MF1-13 TaxID=3379095 RepID=UPI0038920A37